MRIELQPVVEARLEKLEEGLLAQGARASRSDIVQALIFGATAPQTFGMLQDYTRQTALTSLRLPE